MQNYITIHYHYHKLSSTKWMQKNIRISLREIKLDFYYLLGITVSKKQDLQHKYAFMIVKSNKPHANAQEADLVTNPGLQCLPKKYTCIPRLL